MRGTVAAVVRDGGGPIGQRFVRADVITKHEGVVPHGVLEVVIHPLAFHHTADEVKVCFVVLHHVVPGAVFTSLAFFDADAVFGEHGLDDFRRGFLLKDFEVSAPGGMPQLGA